MHQGAGAEAAVVVGVTPFDRVLAVAHNAGVPVVFVEPSRGRSAHRLFDGHSGPYGVTRIAKRRGVPTVFLWLVREHAHAFMNAAALLAHEVAHAVVWALTSLEPIEQDEMAGFDAVERAIRRAAKVPPSLVWRWSRDVNVPLQQVNTRAPDVLVTQSSLTRSEKARLRRIGDRCFRAEAWTQKQREVVG